MHERVKRCAVPKYVGEDPELIAHVLSSYEVMGWNTHIKYKKPIMRNIANIVKLT